MTKQEEFNEAIINNDIEIIKTLLTDNRVDPSVNNNEAIRDASSNGHIEIVKLLLADSRIDIYKLLQEEIPDKLREEINNYIIYQRQDNIDKILNR